ncbi:MAG: elongation factor 1-beta [Methanospirillaceae archaeon]|nr:elongation factor 1-beta [Methanospirillaceae archaeon]
MGDVALIIKVMPTSPDIDLGSIRDTIQKTVNNVQQIQEEPIGFGLVALKVVVVVPDAQGQTDAVEAALSNIKGVERAEIIESTLV